MLRVKWAGNSTSMSRRRASSLPYAFLCWRRASASARRGNRHLKGLFDVAHLGAARARNHLVSFAGADRGGACGAESEVDIAWMRHVKEDVRLFVAPLRPLLPTLRRTTGSRWRHGRNGRVLRDCRDRGVVGSELLSGWAGWSGAVGVWLAFWEKRGVCGRGLALCFRRVCVLCRVGGWHGACRGCLCRGWWFFVFGWVGFAAFGVVVFVFSVVGVFGVGGMAFVARVPGGGAWWCQSRVFLFVCGGGAVSSSFLVCFAGSSPFSLCLGRASGLGGRIKGVWPL